MTGKVCCDISSGDRFEMGSFLELDLKKTGEYFADDNNTARLNSGRSGIYHALRLLNCTKIYLPYYLCPDVKDFLKRKSIRISYYNISEDFEPILDRTEKKSAILIVNHYGILSERKLISISEPYRNVIIDNCASFYSRILPGCYNIYSCRKFFGVPDGCYVCGPDAGTRFCDYPLDQSSDTSLFLLMRIEKGCSLTYHERMKNEERINNSDVFNMSVLTRSIMCSLDYECLRKKRSDNFRHASSLYNPYNQIDTTRYIDDDTVPLFYPLVIRDTELVEKLRHYNIYTGRRWTDVLSEVNTDSFEALLSSYMVPLPIDQRYGGKELNYCFDIFRKVVKI
jgi:hypothetical protein